jgi:meso-butanediol dehydrogenase/(S,S)-butanediol dehydrogenase/diacetyl reductase
VTQRNGQGRVAVVTGGGRGAGRAIAQRLAEDGFAIAIGDVRADSAKQAAKEIATAVGVPTAGFALDVSSATSVRVFAAEVVAELGAIDVLVNNAGVISLRPLTDIDEAEWDRVVDVNLKGAYLCTRAMLPQLTSKGWGRIVNIASDVGKYGVAYLAHYCASKFGLVGFTQAIGVELAQTGVTVNAICPAIMNTEMMKQIARERAGLIGSDADETYRHLQDPIPMGRATEPTDIANVASFLCSDDASFLTGQSLNVTGGGWMN